jgi:D-alanyl-D-alanine carboxypeptidase
MRLMNQAVAISIISSMIIVPIDSLPIKTLASTEIKANISAKLGTKLQANLDNIVKETGIPGATVAIYTPKGNWKGASGFSNLKSKTLMRPEDKFNIASVSKTFTAATILSLVDAHLLSLEDKLDKWLPTNILNNIPNAKNITIRQLLNHTSGIPDYNENPTVQNDRVAFETRDWTPEELIALVKDLPAKNPPGQGFYYSATNYNLAALVVESVTKSSFKDQVRARIIKPLGLNNTVVRPQEPLPDDVISGYIVATLEQRQALSPGVTQFLDTNLEFVDQGNNRFYDTRVLLSRSRGYGSGSIISTSEDVAKFAATLLGGKLLNPKTLKEMLSFVNTGDIREKYGLGVYPLINTDGKVIGHDGQNPGYVSLMGYLPDDKIAVVVLVNERNDYLALDPNQIPQGRSSQDVRNNILLSSIKILLKQEKGEWR